MDLNRKLEKLTEILRAIDTLVVAFSGGVDSTFLLLYARKIFAEGDPNGRDYAAASGSAEDIDDGTRHEGSDNKRNKLLAVTADGPNFVPDEIAYAQKLCRVNDISWHAWPRYCLGFPQQNVSPWLRRHRFQDRAR